MNWRNRKAHRVGKTLKKGENMYWILTALKKYATFGGRARRKEFWFFYLFFVVLLGLSYIFETTFELSNGWWSPTLLSTLLLIVPAIAVTIRRLHDTEKTGWLIFIVLIPFLGFVWLLVMMLDEGHTRENRYGPDPKLAFS